MWRSQVSDTAEFEIKRDDPELGRALSFEVMESLKEEMIVFVAARMVAWLSESQESAMKECRIRIEVEFE